MVEFRVGEIYKQISPFGDTFFYVIVYDQKTKAYYWIDIIEKIVSSPMGYDMIQDDLYQCNLDGWKLEISSPGEFLVYLASKNI